jgi:ABC-type hemin transport system ATPase subunit
LLAIDEALAERRAAVLVPITVMVFPFSVNQVAAMERLRPRKGITAGSDRPLAPLSIFLKKGNFPGYHARA